MRGVDDGEKEEKLGEGGERKLEGERKGVHGRIILRQIGKETQVEGKKTGGWRN